MIHLRKNILYTLTAFFATATLFSCVKEKEIFPKGTGDANRKQIVKIMEGGTDLVQRARGVLPTIDTFLLLDIRREPSTEAELNAPLTVKVKKDPTLITAYNGANGTSFVELPAAAYSILGGDYTTITFQPGEFSKQFRIRFDKSQISLAGQYALAFAIEEVGAGGQISAGQKSIIFAVGVKNKYDGIYEITGTLVDANGLYIGDYGDPTYPREYEMSTSGPSSILFYDISWDYPNYIVINASTGGAANTGIRPEFTFDLATNALVSGVNKNNGTALVITPGSKFNPADRSFDIQWNLGRWTVTEHWEFLRDR